VFSFLITIQKTRSKPRPLYCSVLRPRRHLVAPLSSEEDAFLKPLWQAADRRILRSLEYQYYTPRQHIWWIWHEIIPKILVYDMIYNMIYSFSLSHRGDISKISAAVHIRASMKINIKHKTKKRYTNTKYKGGNKVKCRVCQDLL